ncbi:hypothetical protein CNMCM6106_007641 [Aspergillus hiratsukae]|uniref:Uncharacterized protein n=1 Tax=Aspergillus hiratsukae TaxID=1194566 RepID=A0A8H6UR22_9EURO|nr:hypothetical protein CNMCM6106_007641 [Aspergillus hiratsukae]
MPEDWVDNWIRVAGAEGEELDQVDPQARRQRDKKAVWLALRTRWEERWRAAPRSAAEAVPQPPDARVLQLHEGLHKAESSILTQLRTGKIGLADFLHKAGVPEVEDQREPELSGPAHDGGRGTASDEVVVEEGDLGTISARERADTVTELRVNQALGMQGL